VSERNYDSLHDYYRQNNFKPTFAAFKSVEALTAYENGRAAVFRDLLKIPLKVFDGARLCEFGPDTGENALVFAKWGAQLTLVEPNRAAWPDIEEYFRRFDRLPRLEAMAESTVESFESDRKFDFINAEGFIYTVQPSTVWLDRIASLLAPGGLAVVNYLEVSGCLFELLWTLIYRQYHRLSGETGVDAAWSLFEPKWNSIPHTRAFASWVKDVLENPFVRLKYFIDPVTLLGLAEARGLAFYSSWPGYEAPFDPHWHKKIPDATALRQRRADYISRSRLSFCLGKPLFFTGEADRAADLQQSVLSVCADVDALIDRWDETKAASARRGLARLVEAIADGAILAGGVQRAEATRSLQAFERAIAVMGQGSPDALRKLAREDEDLMQSWGSTTHYIAFRHADPGA
jgi:predicted O-methyltransferase YrrM